MKRLIVNADDYGLTEGVSAGIRRAHLEGVVTSTTTMMNFLPAPRAIAVAREECPQLGLGLHLVLTAGVPLRPAGTVRSLVASSGAFVHLTKWRSGLVEGIDPVELADEWRAQADAFVAAAGGPPTHIDSHHHIATRHAKLLDVLLTLAEDLGVPVRHPLGLEGHEAVLGAGDEASAPATRALAARMRACGHPAGLVSAWLTPKVVRALAEALPDGGVAEAMCHPGRHDDALRQVSSYGRHREQELAGLCDPALRAAIADSGLALCGFGTLAG